MRYYKLLVLAITLFLSINFILADFELGKSSSLDNNSSKQILSHKVETNYGINQPIRGWMNLSLTDQKSDSLLSAFNSNITIFDFLQANSADYSCFPIDCEPTYETKQTKDSSKTLSLTSRKKQVIGVKVLGNITKINSLSFNVSTSTSTSCVYPLQLNVLDDGLIEWKQDEITAGDCFMVNDTGCFDLSTEIVNITTTPFCEKITLTPARAYRVGTMVSGQGPAALQFSLNEEPKTVEISSPGEISTVFEFEEALTSSEEAKICIRAVSEESNNKYQIKFENTLPICGFKGTEDEGILFDFELFARPQKYSAITNEFTFNKNLISDDEYNSMIEYIDNYLYYKYENKCTDGCIIPIAILPGLSQQLTISNLNLGYSIEGTLVESSETEFYLLDSIPSIVSTDYQELDLEKANLLTPSTTGKKDFILELDGIKILEQEVMVKKIPTILSVVPSNPSALVPINFLAILEEELQNITYIWDFGDNSTKMNTTKNNIKHTYPNVGSYPLKLTIQGSFGESTQSFNINAVAPSEGINITLKKYREDLRNIITEINALPAMVKKEIEKYIDTETLQKSVDKQEEEFRDAILDEEYIEIMNKLLALRIPKSLSKGFEIETTDFFQNEEQISLDDLESLDAGTPEADTAEYYNAMNNWIKENLEASFESETYTFNYEDSLPENLFSHVKLNLITKSSEDYLYVVINGDPMKIITPIELNDKDIDEHAKAIILKELESEDTITIEFIHPIKIDLDNFPVYIAPELNKLDLSFEPGICNNNKICESGETTKNCRNDCEPWGKAILFIIILLFIAFLAYIGLQEWYKRRYESHLFKDQNQLFNLINFIQISESQGLKKETIFTKLRAQGWKREQITYAWKKYKGQRTGMWEIPVFKLLEKRKLKKELEKRKDNKKFPFGDKIGTKKTPPNNRKVNKENSESNYKRF